MNDERRKLLIEKVLGEKFHSISLDDGEWRCSCGEVFAFDASEDACYHQRQSRSLSTPNDQHAVMQAIVKAGRWRDFANYALDKYMEERHLLETVEDSIDAMEWLIDPARFCQLAAKWAKERGWEG